MNFTGVCIWFGLIMLPLMLAWLVTEMICREREKKCYADLQRDWQASEKAYLDNFVDFHTRASFRDRGTLLPSQQQILDQALRKLSLIAEQQRLCKREF